MEGVVAKRCLRGVSLDDNRKREMENINRLYNKTMRSKKNVSLTDVTIMDRIILKTKIRIWIQLINSLLILSLIILFNMLEISSVNNSRIVKSIKTEYKRDYSKKQVFGIFKKYTKNTISFMAPIIPDKIENSIKELYANITKNDNRKNIQNTNIEIYRDKGTKNNAEVTKSKAMESKTIKEPAYIESVSAISTIDLNIEKIKAQKLSFVKPTTGNITSRFGAREQVFNDLETYHTGMDIANKEGTKIVSAVAGKVTKVSENEYNGKFVEIESKSVITKYLHMSKVEVKQGKVVKSGELIGLMGSTGMSTGPHLHFEIMINNVKVDPEKVIEF